MALEHAPRPTFAHLRAVGAHRRVRRHGGVGRDDSQEPFVRRMGRAADSQGEIRRRWSPEFRDPYGDAVPFENLPYHR